VHDEEFESDRRVELVRESYREAMIAPQVLTEEDCRENGKAPFGVGLEAPNLLPLGGGKMQQPQNERDPCSDDQQGFESLGAFGADISVVHSESSNSGLYPISPRGRRPDSDDACAVAVGARRVEGRRALP